MNPTDPQFLAQFANAPLTAALVWLIYHLRRDLGDRIATRGGDAPAPPTAAESDALARTRDELSAFKVEVARTYVPLSLIRDVDQRLTSHLLRIEEKLDEVNRTATATAHFYAQAPIRGGDKR
ncbi:hypothetical protein ACQW02_00560 [Humitalea sp. 24SJ18S-53]|uniref:hypothetical protein n=1 Tax=Humitalea sp. 24SJ18S-53 TaxID=3422307 RepID=UPI003D66410B